MKGDGDVFEPTRNISRGKMLYELDGAMLSLSRQTTLASGPRGGYQVQRELERSTICLW